MFENCELEYLIKRGADVINSCETHEQLYVAIEYSILISHRIDNQIIKLQYESMATTLIYLRGHELDFHVNNEKSDIQQQLDY